MAAWLSKKYTFINKYSVDARIVRIFNTYGPNMEKDDGRAISNFISQVLANNPVTIYGDGNQTRSFCYVSDMVDGIIRSMEHDEASGEIINLGNPDERTISEIADLIRKLTDSNVEIEHKPLPSDDPSRRKPDITKAKGMLGWEPKVTLEEGLRRTIDYFKQANK